MVDSQKVIGSSHTLIYRMVVLLKQEGEFETLLAFVKWTAGSFNINIVMSLFRCHSMPDVTGFAMVSFSWENLAIDTLLMSWRDSSLSCALLLHCASTRTIVGQNPASQLLFTMLRSKTVRSVNLSSFDFWRYTF